MWFVNAGRFQPIGRVSRNIPKAILFAKRSRELNESGGSLGWFTPVAPAAKLLLRHSTGYLPLYCAVACIVQASFADMKLGVKTFL